ncbi:hypothetical protein SAY87_003094 [Trapa incisa]|uniref:Protein kinase domain-containing protein n=1 Tax=Trapa incisa TaxID=236973 RepID=A0AAN7KF59_9MYRT|nr:hypothetical protein SAY87_003094 [Trapa incisa]
MVTLTPIILRPFSLTASSRGAVILHASFSPPAIPSAGLRSFTQSHRGLLSLRGESLRRLSFDICAPVWMANRDIPVNSKGSRLSLMDDGNLILTDAVAGIEIVLVFVVWFLFFRNQQDITGASHVYSLAPTGFRRYTYNELRKATKNFSEEIGRGAGGIVYKGVLPDRRLAAVKLLNEDTTGEADFLAEVSIIGKLNHMNITQCFGIQDLPLKLIPSWIFINRLLVYEYVEHEDAGMDHIGAVLLVSGEDSGT